MHRKTKETGLRIPEISKGAQMVTFLLCLFFLSALGLLICGAVALHQYEKRLEDN